jgi:hypothetical protein
MKLALVVSAMIFASVVLPTPRRTPQNHRPACGSNPGRRARSARAAACPAPAGVPGRCIPPACAAACARPAARCAACLWGLPARRQKGSSHAPRRRVPGLCRTSRVLVFVEGWEALPPTDRCRAASYSSTLAATAAFRLSTGPGQGIVSAPSALRQFERDAVAFVADQQRHRPGQITRSAGCAPRTVVVQTFTPPRAAASNTPFTRREQRKPKDAPRRGAHRFGVPGAHGSRQADHAIRAKGLSRAQNGSQIAGILQFRQHQNQQWSFRWLSSSAPRSSPAVRPAQRRAAAFPWSERESSRLWAPAESPSSAGSGKPSSKPLIALGHKHAIDAQPRPQSLFEQVRPLDSGQNAPIGTRLAQRLIPARGELLEAWILFTLYNSKRHRSETVELAKPILSRLPGARRQEGSSRATCTASGAVLVSDFRCLRIPAFSRNGIRAD